MKERDRERRFLFTGDLFAKKAKGTISVHYTTMSSYAIQAHKILLKLIGVDYLFTHSVISPSFLGTVSVAKDTSPREPSSIRETTD